jgi:hypothetical protein
MYVARNVRSSKVVLLPGHEIVRESLSHSQAKIPLTNSPWMSVNR